MVFGRVGAGVPMQQRELSWDPVDANESCRALKCLGMTYSKII